MTPRVGAAVVGLVAIVAATMARFSIPQIPAIARDVVFDTYQRLSPRGRSDVPVRVVDIDEASLVALGQWPWPRTRITEMTDRLTSLGAAAIAFDILFAEPDATSPQRVAASLPVPEADRER